MRTVDGLFRLCKEAEIFSCSYNYDTCTLGQLSFISPIPFVADYIHSRSHLPKIILWEMLLKYSNALAVYFANNYYCMLVFKDHIVAIDAYGEESARMYPTQIHMRNMDLVEIGYTKTIPETKEIALYPYKLFFDKKSWKAYIGDDWFTLDRDPGVESKIELWMYKDLIRDGGDAIYLDDHGRARTFACEG